MKDYYPGNLGGNDKRFNRSHRSYDSPLTRDMGGNQRRNGYHNRKKSSQTHGADAFNEMLSTIKDQLQQISENQKRMADIQERSSVAEERKAEALEKLVEHITQWFAPSAEKSVGSGTASEAPEVFETVEEEGKSIMETITDMRDNGITFGKIADYLNEEGIPTATGANLWNRLTVSKFYKEAVAQ